MASNTKPIRRIWLCDRCGKGLSRKDSLKRHNLVCGRPSEPRPTWVSVCPGCDEKIVAIRMIRAHWRRDHPEYLDGGIHAGCAMCQEFHVSHLQNFMAHLFEAHPEVMVCWVGEIVRQAVCGGRTATPWLMMLVDRWTELMRDVNDLSSSTNR